LVSSDKGLNSQAVGAKGDSFDECNHGFGPQEEAGENLLDYNFITPDQLAQGMDRQKISKKKLGEILTELGFVTEERLNQALAVQLGKTITDLFPRSAPIPGKVKKLGEILVDAKLITRDQLFRGIEEQKKTNKRLGEVLTDLGFVSEEALSRSLSAQLGVPHVDLKSIVVEPEAITLLTEKLARKNLVLPLSVDKRFITVAMADPLDLEVINDIRFASNREVRPVIASCKEIKAAIRRFYHLSDTLEKILGEIHGEAIEVVAEREGLPEADAMEELAKKSASPPIIRLVNSVIVHAARNRASDIHFEPRVNTFRVRERIDGLLMEAFEFPNLVQGAVTSRIKIMARMDIAEKNIPQDGRIKLKVEGRELDLRVSTLPTQYGEKITIRILDILALKLSLEEVCPGPREYRHIRSIIDRPQGIVIITGPTGSGKTSTLYAMVNHIKSKAINIITPEDPIEYELKGVNQVAINEKTGLTFGFALRSVLRQDPDVIMVGEMRDSETANIAVEASLTGHLVLSTLHTNNAVGAITRLKNMGIHPHLVASSLNGVVAQRLVRRICDQCKQPYTPSEEDLLRIRLWGKDPATFKSYKGTGCPACNYTGYKGRTGVFEVLTVSSGVQELIASDAVEEAICRAALDGGMKYMSEDGLEKVNRGITSMDELLRVLHVRGEEEAFLCPNCYEAIRRDSAICPFCDYVVVNKCPTCGAAREVRWMYCPYCGWGFQTHMVPLPLRMAPQKKGEGSAGRIFSGYGHSFRSNPAVQRPEAAGDHS
jgi:type IV pilus assembly protein PilB